MGMYDEMNVEIPCPRCGATVTGFQSKDGWCNLDVIDASTVRSFYASCDNCEKWIHYYIPQKDVQDEPPKGLEYVLSLGFKLANNEE